MKKTMVPFSIAFGILVLWLGINLAPVINEFKAMHPVNSKQVSKELTAIKNGISNLYLVTNGNTYTLIDAGVDLNSARKEITRLKINPESVQAILLTHSDNDHTAALKLFKNAQVYLGANEEPMINGEKTRFFGFINNKLPVPTYQLLSDGSQISIDGIKIKAIATPGHTPGSMSYLVNDQILFTGDTLGLKEGQATLFTPHIFNLHEKEQLETIAKLAQLNKIAILCTGHHGITDNFDYAMENWRK